MADAYDRDVVSPFRVKDVNTSFTYARAEENPFSSMVRKGKPPVSSLFEWKYKSRHTPSDNAVADGVDVADSEVINSQGLKAMLQGRYQKARVVVGVTDVANELGNEYAQDGTLLAETVADGIILSRENLEVTCLKNTDSQANSDNSTPGKLRGLTNWIRSSNPGTPDLAVPSAALCPTASIVTGKTAATNVTEDDVRGVMKSISSSARRNGTWDVFVTPDMKSVFSGWARTGDASTTTAPLRRFNANASDGTLTLNIQIYESDFGKLRLHTHFSLPSGVHALFVDMESCALRPVRNAMVKPLEYRGGGYRRFIEYITGLEVSNPRMMGKITT